MQLLPVMSLIKLIDELFFSSEILISAHNCLELFQLIAFTIASLFLPFSILFSNIYYFFLFSKKLPIVVVRDVCPSFRLSVRLSSVKIIYFRGNLISSKPIDLKIGLNVRYGVLHVRKA